MKSNRQFWDYILIICTWVILSILSIVEQLYFPMSSFVPVAAAAKSLQLCPALCDPIDGSPRGSPVPGILQARTLEWVAISFSNAGKWKVKMKSLSLVRLLLTPWTVAHQAPPSMGFSRQECWSGVPLPSMLSERKHKLSGNVDGTTILFLKAA